MSRVYFQLESPSGTVRRSGYVEVSLQVKQGGVVKQTISDTTTVTKSSGGKVANGDIQIGNSSVVPCNGKMLPNDMILRAILKSNGNYELFTASGTFVVPYGVTQITVFCVGGGAGGNSQWRSPRDAYGGGGGGGGYTTQKTLSVTSGGSYSVVVGNGGAGGNESSDTTAPGGAGGNSTFNGASCVANGAPQHKYDSTGTNRFRKGGDGGSGGGGGGWASDAGSEHESSTAGNGGTNGGNGGNGQSGGTGQGTTTSFTFAGSSHLYAGGGGGGGIDDEYDTLFGKGGEGGGGNGAKYGGLWNWPTPGTANTGGGGGGGGYGGGANGAAGGKGIVVITW